MPSPIFLGGKKLQDKINEQKVEIEEQAAWIKKLESIITHHHDVTEAHYVCGKDAQVANWGLTCRVCFNLGHLAITGD